MIVDEADQQPKAETIVGGDLFDLLNAELDEREHDQEPKAETIVGGDPSDQLNAELDGREHEVEVERQEASQAMTIQAGRMLKASNAR
jgi:hypothetical protein